jgi:acyl-CoA thioesterase I
MNRSKALSYIVLVLVTLAILEGVLLISNNNEEIIQEPVRVACVGDSITRGTEYTLYLWEKLGDKYVVGDFGVGGVTVSLQSDSAYMNTTAFELARQYKPNIVVIMLGTNDASNDLNVSRQDVVSSYLSLIDSFESLDGDTEIFLVLPPPLFDNSANLNARLLEEIVVPAIVEVANVTGLPLFDVHTPLLAHPDFFIDGVHPKVSGAIVIADVVYGGLEKSLSDLR